MSAQINDPAPGPDSELPAFTFGDVMDAMKSVVDDYARTEEPQTAGHSYTRYVVQRNRDRSGWEDSPGATYDTPDEAAEIADRLDRIGNAEHRVVMREIRDTVIRSGES